MNDTTPLRTVGTIAIPAARPVRTVVTLDGGVVVRWAPSAGTTLATAPVAAEHLAILSAICGLTGIIPILSQFAGLAFGIVSLGRIRRARTAGVFLRGRCLAATGIISSALGLVGWLGFVATLSLAGGWLSQATSALNNMSGVDR